MTTRGLSSTSNRDQYYLFTALFEDNGTILIERAGANGTVRISWYVIEFEDGVKVQRGFTSMKDTTISKNIDLPLTFDPTKTFVILQLRAAYKQWDLYGKPFGTAGIVDLDTITISRGCRSVNTAQTYVYQVVEFQTDATIQTAEVSMPYNVTSVNATWRRQ